MTDQRKTAPLRHEEPVTGEDREAEARHMITQALRMRLCLRWVYNRTAMQAAPQVLYHRNEKLYCDAVVIEQGGAAPQEPKLSSFRLLGLSDIVLTTDPAAPWPDLDLAADRYEDVLARLGD